MTVNAPLVLLEFVQVTNNPYIEARTRTRISVNVASFRDLALKVIYIIIGTVGILDNLFVLVIFILFIKITDKVRNRSLSLAPCLQRVVNFAAAFKREQMKDSDRFCIDSSKVR